MVRAKLIFHLTSGPDERVNAIHHHDGVAQIENIAQK